MKHVVQGMVVEQADDLIDQERHGPCRQVTGLALPETLLDGGAAFLHRLAQFGEDGIAQIHLLLLGQGGDACAHGTAVNDLSAIANLFHASQHTATFMQTK